MTMKERNISKTHKGPYTQQGVWGGETSLSNGKVSYQVWQEALRPSVI